MWQDLVVTVGSLVFSVALVPAVLSREKPPISTSLSTGLVLLVFAATYGSLGLLFSTVTTAVNGSLWLVLAVQRWRRPAPLTKSVR